MTRQTPLSWIVGPILGSFLVVLAGCDLPTESPSFRTETDVESPLVAEKTYSFLGGPQSQFEPLVDTTTSVFDSLFTVGEDPKDIALEQRIDDFDIGTLDGALDEAGGTLGLNNSSFSEDLFPFSSGNLPDIVVYTQGTLTMEQNDKVAFADDDHYVQLVDANVEMTNTTIDPSHELVDTLDYTYPDVRLPPFQVGDSLVVRFINDPSCASTPCEKDGTFEFDKQNLDQGFTINPDTVQVYPNKPKLRDQATIDFGIRAWLNEDETVSDDDTLSVSGEFSIQQFELRELSVSDAKPFTVNVTPDANGDGNLDIADDDETQTASFDGFKGITNRVEGLRIASTRLDLSVDAENIASTDAELYAALLGTSETDRVYLAGTDDGTSVSSPVPYDDTFVDGGSAIDLSNLIRFKLDLEDAVLGQPAQRSIQIDEQNSTVSDFINALPTQIRLAGQAHMNSDAGDLALRKPLFLDAGFLLSLPLRIEGSFTVRDTMAADFSGLQDLTDPDQTLNLSKAELLIDYRNELPLGADVEMTILDAQDAPVATLPRNDQARLEPAPKDADGAASGPRTGTLSFSLGESQDELRALSEGQNILLRLTVIQDDTETAARMRADDTLRLSLRTDVESTVGVGN